MEEQLSEAVPDVFFLIHKCGMDAYVLFAANYYSLLTYGAPPDELGKQMIDLFFLEGEKAITALIVRMLEIAHSEIMKIEDAFELQQFMKSTIFHYCFETLCREKQSAKRISDFGLSFYQSVDIN